ncbi:hypothetical protein K7432_003260 [Basidiobolus ranarum]|uniref:Endoglucanase n=1 Tax=Basidiobolus ranarum TaxID=34480 RepID=A0ABR2W6H4_9FUNG
MFSNIFGLVLLLLALVHITSGHMEMVEPPPRRSSHNPYFQKKGDVDDDIMSPLSDKRPFPCQGASKGPSVNTYSAGSSVKIKIAGGTPHQGGTCQFVISYDSKNWVVLKTVLRDCLNSGLNFDVPLPANAPSGEAVLAWTWISKEGNRDFYMNCADVTIKGKLGGSITGPKLAIAQLPSYPKIPEYPEKGWDDVSIFEKRPMITINSNGSISKNGKSDIQVDLDVGNNPKKNKEKGKGKGNDKGKDKDKGKGKDKNWRNT